MHRLLEVLIWHWLSGLGIGKGLFGCILCLGVWLRLLCLLLLGLVWLLVPLLMRLLEIELFVRLRLRSLAIHWRGECGLTIWLLVLRRRLLRRSAETMAMGESARKTLKLLNRSVALLSAWLRYYVRLRILLYRRLEGGFVGLNEAI